MNYNQELAMWERLLNELNRIPQNSQSFNYSCYHAEVLQRVYDLQNLVKWIK